MKEGGGGGRGIASEVKSPVNFSGYIRISFHLSPESLESR